MKQLMEFLGLDIPKWEGPTLCESAAAPAESAADVKPPRSSGVNEKVKKEERKREAPARTDHASAKEETVLVKKERAESPVEKSEEEKS